MRHTAVEARNIGAITLMLEYDFSLQNKDTRGYQALHLAAENGSTDTVKLLGNKLQSKSVDGMSTQKHTPLALSSQNGYTEILIDNGADPNKRNRKITHQ